MVYKKPYVERGVAVAEITAITPQKMDRTRCNIEVDGRFYCGMKLETVMKNRLKAGQTVCADELSRMQLESEKTTAFDKALTHITATAKTEREVRLFLQKKGYLGDVCDYVVDKMKEYGFLDDGEYARAYVKSACKDKGRLLIALKLKQKGVSDEETEAALDCLENESESAKRVLEKYLRGKERDAKTLQKAYAHLLSRGYDYDTAKAALSELRDED